MRDHGSAKLGYEMGPGVSAIPKLSLTRHGEKCQICTADPLVFHPEFCNTSIKTLLQKCRYSESFDAGIERFRGLLSPRPDAEAITIYAHATNIQS